MKLIIAHLPADAFEPARNELLDLGVVNMTVTDVNACGSESATTLQWRGAPLHTHLHSELRLECVASAEQSSAVISALRGYARTCWGFGGRVAVMDLDDCASPDEVYTDDPRVAATA